MLNKGATPAKGKLLKYDLNSTLSCSPEMYFEPVGIWQAIDAEQQNAGAAVFTCS